MGLEFHHMSFEGTQTFRSDHDITEGRNTEVGCHFLLQGIFPTQGSNSCLPLFRQILCLLNHQRSPRDLLYRELIPLIMTPPSWPNRTQRLHLKICFGVRISIYEFWGDTSIQIRPLQHVNIFLFSQTSLLNLVF